MNVAVAHGHGDGGDSSAFIYTGQERVDIPWLVTHVRVDPSVKAIKGSAFCNCELLEVVDLCEGLEKIGWNAFLGCKNLIRISIPSTVRVIGFCSFSKCERLERVDLREGLEIIENHAFHQCESLNGVTLPSTVKMIGDRAFEECKRMEYAQLCDGLEQINESTFYNCKSLKRIKIPSSLKKVACRTFYDCSHMREVDLAEGLEDIEDFAFFGCKAVKCINIPSSVNSIASCAFHGCSQLISVRLSDMIENISFSSFVYCTSLRNIALPPAAPASFCFEGCHDMMKLFGTHEKIYTALRSRFDGLGLHKLCYYQSNCSSELSHEQLHHLSGLSSDQDILGMTPLHILACTRNQNIHLYQLIVANQPKSLILEDRWGCIPITYAIWLDSSQEILQFLIESQKDAFPNFVMNWENMIETICRAGVSLETVISLLKIQQTYFPEQNINSQKAAKELTIGALIRCTSFGDFPSVWGNMMEAITTIEDHDEVIESLHDIQHNYFPDQQTTNLQHLCVELSKPLIGWWSDDSGFSNMTTFHSLLKCNIPERMIIIGVRKWRLDIQTLIKRIPTLSDVILSFFDNINCKLVYYEHEYHLLKECTYLLELALWKSEINRRQSANGARKRTSCRISCGADVIIPNVVPFLIGSS